MTSQASLRQLTICTRHNIDGKGMLMLDKTRVQQIVLHLLSNAIKFSEQQGVITVEVTAAKLDVSSMDLRIQI